MHDTDLIPMTVPEVRRLLLTLAEPDERFNLRLAWSIFRRHHQAIAKRCHATRRSLRVRASAAQLTTTQLDFTLNSTSAPGAPGAPGASTIQILCDGNWSFELDEERWKLISPLLPPQKPRTGRPANDHRTILEGIFWVMRSGGSWRDLPTSFGPWQTLYTRYQRWCKAGIWQQILDTLNHEEIY
jgi:hypothetical protein